MKMSPKKRGEGRKSDGKRTYASRAAREAAATPTSKAMTIRTRQTRIY